MCGIVGSLHQVAAPGAWPSAPEARSRMTKALTALAYRGPDGEGQWWSDDLQVGLGHRRLALVDLEHGAQPLVFGGSSPVIVVVNGEFYDPGGRIRLRLEAAGHRFRTRSDSELLVHLYREHGLDCVKHLRGEFAFLLWDGRERRLLAARDRFGVKPLVFARFSGGLHFASQTKALFELGLEQRWNASALTSAFHQQYLPLGEHLVAGVEELRPGQLLIATTDAVETRTYWDLDLPSNDTPAEMHDERALVEEFSRRLDEAVTLRLRGDEPVAYCLSGGVDSNAVLALGSADADGAVDAFTLSFDDAAYDEQALAAAGAQAQGARLHTIQVGPHDVLEQLDLAVERAEGLAINGQLSAKMMLSRTIRERGFKVALTGEGSDEMLMGYAHLRRDRLGSSSCALLEGNRVSLGLMLPGAEGPLAAELAPAATALGEVPSYLRAKEEMTRPLRALLREDLRGPAAAGQSLMRLLEACPHGQLASRPLVRKSQYLWSRHVLAGYILRTLGDGAEMANGVEGRPPFLDHELFEFCRSLPTELLLRAGRDKYILRQAMGDRVPASIVEREKHPFLLPPLCGRPDASTRGELRARLHAAASLPVVDSSALRSFAERLPELSPEQARSLDPSVMLLLSAEALGRRLALRP